MNARTEAQTKLNEICLLVASSLLPYGLELTDDILFFTFFGYIYYPEALQQWVIHTFFSLAFHPLRPFGESLQILYIWSVVVIIPLLFNLLLIFYSYRSIKSDVSTHRLPYLAVGALMYSIGLSTLSGIVSLPFTPVLFFILQFYNHRKKLNS